MNDVYASLYTIKWFMQCFLDRVSILCYVASALCFSITIDKYLDTLLASPTARKVKPPTIDKRGQNKLADCLSYYSPNPAEPVTAKHLHCDWLRRSRTSAVTNDVSSVETQNA